MPGKTISDSHYEMSHGRKPRGYGLWVFATLEAFRASHATSRLPAGMVEHTGTFTEARAALDDGDWIVMP
jgi:hypothetical protein